MTVRVLAVGQSDVYSGAEAVFGAIVTGLAARAEFDVVAATNATLTAELTGAGVEVRPVPPLSTRAPAVRAFRPAGLRAVGRLIRSTGPDVVLVNLPSAEHGGALLGLASLLGVPAVGLVHVAHTPVQMASRGAWLRTALTRLGTQRAGTLLALSPQNADLVRSNWAGPRTSIGRFALPERRLTPVARAAARARFGWADEPVVGIAGRIALQQKGHGVLAEAAELLLERGAGLRFAVAGEGPDEAALRDDLAARGISGAFDLLGQVDIAAFLAAIDLLVIPSFYEGVPLVALEALDAGTPGVATSIAGLAEVWPTRWQVPAGDARALADALQRVAATPAAEAGAVLDAAREAAASLTTDDPSALVAAALLGARSRA